MEEKTTPECFIDEQQTELPQQESPLKKSKGFGRNTEKRLSKKRAYHSKKAHQEFIQLSLLKVKNNKFLSNVLL